MTDATASALAEALRDRYTLERELGRGGMATVYLALDLRHERAVALKVLRPELAVALGPERFLREIRLTARLQHPHLLTVLDSGEAAGRLWFTMPYVEGESLRHRLARERQLSITDAIRITLDAAQALEYAHQHGVIHRDVKPENLLLTADSSTLLADFGIARGLAAAANDLTGTGLAVGTPTYMSPEQAGGAGDLDVRTDIYSLGCVLYEMLAGLPPFSGANPAAVIARKSVEAVPALRTVRETVPNGLEDVILRALAKVPADRFATMRAFADALRVFGDGAATGGKTVVAPARRRAPIAGLAVALLVAVGAASWAWAHRDSDLVPRRVAVTLFENRTGDSSLSPLGSMAADWLTEGILRSGLAEVVPTSTTMFVASALPSGSSGTGNASDIRRLAEETRAGTIVSGSYYRIGDSLQFQVRLVDGQGERLLAVAPVTGPADRPVEIIDRLRQRVLGALAVQLDTTIDSHELVNAPPTFAAYRAYLDGVRLVSQFRFVEAIPHLDSALVLDSTFMAALLAKAVAHADAGQLAKFDSLAQVLERRRGRLSPAEAYDLDWLVATRRGDLVGALRALRQKTALTPDPATRYVEAVFALRINRPREALGALTERDAGSIFWRTWSWTWQVPTEAYHLIGNHTQELKEAQRGRKQHQDLVITLHYEILARAALGQVEAVDSLLEEVLRLTPQPIWTYGSVAAITGLELRAHGHPDPARRMMQRAIEWYSARVAEDPRQPENRYGLAQCLYWGGRWREAQELAAGLLAEVPDSGAPWHGVGTASDFDYLGLLGAVAARRGDSVEARRIAGRLQAIERPNFLFGHPTLWRARIAAILGDRDRAVGLLREAIGQGLMPLDLTQGLGYPMWLHRDVDFEPLRDYPPFQTLMQLPD